MTKYIKMVFELLGVNIIYIGIIAILWNFLFAVSY